MKDENKAADHQSKTQTAARDAAPEEEKSEQKENNIRPSKTISVR